jgi:hypothetical protein
MASGVQYIASIGVVMKKVFIVLALALGVLGGTYLATSVSGQPKALACETPGCS